MRGTHKYDFEVPVFTFNYLSGKYYRVLANRSRNWYYVSKYSGLHIAGFRQAVQSSWRQIRQLILYCPSFVLYDNVNCNQWCTANHTCSLSKCTTQYFCTALRLTMWNLEKSLSCLRHFYVGFTMHSVEVGCCNAGVVNEYLWRRFRANWKNSTLVHIILLFEKHNVCMLFQSSHCLLFYNKILSYS